LVSEQQRWRKIETVSYLVRSLSQEIQTDAIFDGENAGRTKYGCDLLVEIFHRGSTENDEEADPKRGSLEGNCFVELFIAFFCLIRLEEYSIKKEGQKTEHEKQLDKEDNQICRMVLDPASGLRGDDLIDIVEIDTAGKKQNDQQNASNFLVMLIECIGNWLDLVPRDCCLQPRCHGNDEERQSADPDDRRDQVKPMIDDWNNCMRIGYEPLKGIHLCNSR